MALLLSCGCGETAAPLAPAASGARLHAVPMPPTGTAVYEPHVAVAGDGAVLVTGQYGEGYNRGGLRFWTAHLTPGGEWTAGETVLTRPEYAPTMAADATVAAGTAGRWYLFGLAADSTRHGVPDASLLLAQVPETRVLARIREVSEPRPGLLLATDKPWMVRDPGDEGRDPSLVLGWTELEVDLDQSPVSIRRTLKIGVTTDDGPFRHDPVSVAPEAMGVQLTVGPNGSLDAVWTVLREQGNAPSVRILHARSVDGGRSWGRPETVVDMGAVAPATVGHASLATEPDGGLLACWPRWTGDEGPTFVDCAERRGASGWVAVESPGNGGPATRSFPAVAWASGRWWLSFYEASEPGLRVSLASTAPGDGVWRDEGALAETAGYSGQFCPAPSLPCRSDPGAFFPGDYVSAAGEGATLAFAYVLPGLTSRAGDRLMVSVLEPGLPLLTRRTSDRGPP